MKYQINDTIIDKNGNTRKILGTFREYYILTYDNSDEVCRELLTLLELDFYGFTLKVTEWTPEINEEYYYPNIEVNSVRRIFWFNCEIDNSRKDLNLIFPFTPRGKKQAKARLLEVVELLKK